MPSVAIVDTYYPEALDALLVGANDLNYDRLLRRLLDASFGTSDYVSASLRARGWEAADIIGNCDQLQQLWAREHLYPKGIVSYASPAEIAVRQILEMRPNVVFLQDLSFFDVGTIYGLQSQGFVVAGQCSCPWPGDAAVGACNVVFTSFPHYVERIAKTGARAQFLKLAFSPLAAERAGAFERDLPVTFVGGFGRHWDRAPGYLEQLARVVPEFRWWGYGIENVRGYEALRAAYQGPAWGLDMYRIYARSQIVVNRHGEVAESCGNNLRQYEATGMGAMLLTDCVGRAGSPAENFAEGEVVVYDDGLHLTGLVQHYLGSTGRGGIAHRGRERTWSEHTYDHRAEVLDSVLRRRL